MTSPRLARVGGLPVDLIRAARVTIDTGGVPILDRETYVSGTLTIDGAGPVATRAVQIRGRGNTTWSQPKKPYKVKLGSAASLVPGVPADRDWVLLTNYAEDSQIRAATAFEIGRRSPGLAWTPRFRFVEFTLNGAFQGLYLLGEHVKIDGDRIDIDKMGAGDTAGLGLTGGYTMAIDYNDPTTFFTPHDNHGIVMDEPDGTVPEQLAYLQQWFTDFETALYANDWLDPEAGYRRFVDWPSFIDWYLVEELAANVDSEFYKSCKMYKTRDTGTEPGRLHMGPIWDFDSSFGYGYVDGGLSATARTPDKWYTRLGATWIDRMMDDPGFVAALRTRWAAMKTDLTVTRPAADFIARESDRVAYAYERNRFWGYASDRSVEAAAVSSWLSARISWLDTWLPGT